MPEHSPDLPIVSSLWIGPPLSFLEHLCLKSFVDAGHPTKLYVYDEVGNVPAGVEIADAHTILPTTEFVVNAKTGSPGPQADKFRYHLLRKTNEIWADTDVYCRKPLPDTPYLYACHFKDLLTNAVLRLPKTSHTLNSLLGFTLSEYPEPPEGFPHLPQQVWDQYHARRDTDNPMHTSEFPWETWGPFALTYYAKMHDEFKHATDKDVLYPLGGGEIFRTLQMPRRAQIEIPDECVAIHFYGSKIRDLLSDQDGIPAPRSFLGELCAKHGVDPNSAPLPAKDIAC